MITLVQFPSLFGVPNPSPFCMKVEIQLKMAGLPYTGEISPDPRKGPKGKLPMIRDGDVTIGDSAMIQHYLETRYGLDLDTGLDQRERAVAHGMARMCEERLYWCLVYSRWIEPENWVKIREAFFGGLPPVIRSIVPKLARRGLRATLHGQGLGRHSRE